MPGCCSYAFNGRARKMAGRIQSKTHSEANKLVIDRSVLRPERETRSRTMKFGSVPQLVCAGIQDFAPPPGLGR
jgi:hypothetical protein